MVYAPDLVPEDPMVALVREVEAIKRALVAMGSADLLATAGIRTEPGGIIIEGNLSVPNGSINNDALASPTSPAVGAGTTGAGVPLGTTPSNYATATLVVPAGFTRAQVVAVSSAYMGGDGMQMRTLIGATFGDFMNVIPTTSPGLANGCSTHSAILTGLTGGASVVVGTSAMRVGAPATTAYMTTSAMAIFYR